MCNPMRNHILLFGRRSAVLGATFIKRTSCRLVAMALAHQTRDTKSKFAPRRNCLVPSASNFVDSEPEKCLKCLPSGATRRKRS